MDGQSLNAAVGLGVAIVALISWTAVWWLEAEHPVHAPAMWLLSLGFVLVSSLSLTGAPWWVGVFAAANRAIVAGLGLRALWLIHQARRGARLEP